MSDVPSENGGLLCVPREYQNKRGKLLSLVEYNQIPAKFTVNC
jgi:hypothetical protein